MPCGDDIEQRYIDFIVHFERNIRSFCIRTSENLADADDLMQEIFAYLWDNLPSLDPAASPRQMNRWLYRVMMTVLNRHLRRRFSYIFTNLDNMADLSSVADLPDDTLDMLAEHLGSDDRRLLQHLRDGYTAPEIASLEGISAKAAYTRVHRLKKRLKTIYDKHHGKQ